MGNNLYLCNSTASKSQNIIYNNKGILNNNDDKDSSNNFCDLSKLNVNNTNLHKNIINQINCPPFITSNYPKKEKDQFFRKKSEDSLSKDKVIPLRQFLKKKKMKFRMNQLKKYIKKEIMKKLTQGNIW